MTQTHWLLNLCHHLGFQINYDKFRPNSISGVQFCRVSLQHMYNRSQSFPDRKTNKNNPRCGSPILEIRPRLRVAMGITSGPPVINRRTCSSGKKASERVTILSAITMDSSTSRLVKLTPSAVKFTTVVDGKSESESGFSDTLSKTKCPGVHRFLDPSLGGAHLDMNLVLIKWTSAQAKHNNIGNMC